MARQPFFSGSELAVVKEPPSKIPQCGVCQLDKQCISKKMPVYGSGRRKIMVVGEAPGKNEDEKGRPFVGDAGQRLRKTLSKHGIDLDIDCWATNALICRPPENKIPSSEYIDYCRPNLLNAIEKYNPEIILLTGYSPVMSLIGHYWKAGIGESIARWVGWKIPHAKTNTWICPTYHPSYLIRQEDMTLDLFFDQHIREMSRLQGRPWQSVPDYESRIKLVTDEREAAAAIYDYIDEGKAVAVDYETTCLKPDGPHAKIVCCSIANKTRCHSFLWHPKLVEPMREFWQSDVPKIASNLKMEDRWTRRILGVEVNRWSLCTANAAHVLDNRSEITSIKFQAFIHLGVDIWNTHIEQYLKPKDEKCGNAPNRIHEVGWKDLLLYCGFDSVYEYEVAERQSKQLGLYLE